MDFAPAVGARGCTGSATPGALALAASAVATWGHRGLTLAGIYNCRPVAGTSTWSLHAEGRAVDLGVSNADPGVSSEVLDALLHGGDMTLQRIIFNREIYDEAAPAGRPFYGDNPHTDHLHVELSWAAARGDIPLELQDDVDDPEDTVPNLIVAWRNAQWVVAGDLSSKQGVPTPADVTALLRVGEGRAYVAATLSDSLMSRIPVASA